MKVYIQADRLFIKNPDQSQRALINAFHALLKIEARGDGLTVRGDEKWLYHLLFSLAAKYDIDLI